MSHPKVPISIGAVVLAAGTSSRMGQPKMLLPFGDRPLLARVLETLRSAGRIAPILVVTGHAREQVEAIAAPYPDVRTVHNAGYAEGGMLSSVKAGVAELPTGLAGFFLVLGDQPLVRPETLRAVMAAWEDSGAETARAPIAWPVCEGRRGHPVLFDASLATEILALPPDETLKTITGRHAPTAREIPVPDRAILSDIDTPADYTRALEEWRARDRPDAP